MYVFLPLLCFSYDGQLANISRLVTFQFVVPYVCFEYLHILEVEVSVCVGGVCMCVCMRVSLCCLFRIQSSAYLRLLIENK